MGRKSGRAVNPADQHRKEQRKKEIKKNKKDRARVREVGSAIRDTTTEVELEEYEAQEKAGKLDKDGKKKLEELREKFAKIIEIKKAHGIKIKKKVEEPVAAPVTQEPQRDPTRSIYYDPILNPYGAPPPGMPYLEHPPLPMEMEIDQAGPSEPMPAVAEEAEEEPGSGDDDSDDDSTGSSSSSSSSGTDSESENDPDMPSLPEGPPPSKEQQEQYLALTRPKPAVQQIQPPPIHSNHPNYIHPSRQVAFAMNPGRGFPPGPMPPPGMYNGMSPPMGYPPLGTPPGFPPNYYGNGVGGGGYDQPPPPGFMPIHQQRPGPYNPYQGNGGPPPPGYGQQPPPPQQQQRQAYPSQSYRPPSSSSGRPTPRPAPRPYRPPARTTAPQHDPMLGAEDDKPKPDTLPKPTATPAAAAPEPPTEESESKDVTDEVSEAPTTTAAAAAGATTTTATSTLPKVHPLPKKPTAPGAATAAPVRPAAPAGPTSISAAPQLRNLQKELTHLVPASLMRKRAVESKRIGKRVNAAPGVEDESVGQAESRGAHEYGQGSNVSPSPSSSSSLPLSRIGGSAKSGFGFRMPTDIYGSADQDGDGTRGSGGRDNEDDDDDDDEQEKKQQPVYRESGLGLRLPNMMTTAPLIQIGSRSIVINSAPNVTKSSGTKAQEKEAKKKAEYDEFLQDLEGDGLL